MKVLNSRYQDIAYSNNSHRFDDEERRCYIAYIIWTMCCKSNSKKNLEGLYFLFAVGCWLDSINILLVKRRFQFTLYITLLSQVNKRWSWNKSLVLK